MNEGSQFIIVYDDMNAVGFAAYQELKPGIWKLHKIYVLGSQQGKGTGKFMIDYIIKKIMLLGAKTLELQVNRNNKAKTFYEKLGFSTREELDLDIGNGYFMRDFVMEKTL